MASQLLGFYTLFGSTPEQAVVNGKIRMTLHLNESTVHKCLMKVHQKQERKIILTLTLVFESLLKIVSHSYQYFLNKVVFPTLKCSDSYVSLK